VARSVLAAAAALAAATLLAIGLSAVPAAAEDALRPGLWRITTTTVTNGAATPPQTATRCLTPEQTADLATTFSPQFGSVNSACERTEFKADAGRMHWRLECTGQLDMDVVGDFTFDTPLHYTATIASKGAMAGRQILSSSAGLEGEHIGECP
jgi:Protein of unknown function (DUF3617)